MRGLFLISSAVLMLSFASNVAGAGSRIIEVAPAEVPAGFETYKGYIYDLSENVEFYDFPPGKFDIDTPADFEILKSTGERPPSV